MTSEEHQKISAAAIEPLAKAGCSKDEIVSDLRLRFKTATEAFEAKPHADQWLALERAMAAYQTARVTYKAPE